MNNYYAPKLHISCEKNPGAHVTTLTKENRAQTMMELGHCHSGK